MKLKLKIIVRCLLRFLCCLFNGGECPQQTKTETQTASVKTECETPEKNESV